jgi:hypothetical protein
MICDPRAWICPDCGSIEYGDYYCESCAQLERDGRVSVEVTLPHQIVIVEDFAGTADEARAMVERHYSDATGAVIRIGER